MLLAGSAFSVTFVSCKKHCGVHHNGTGDEETSGHDNEDGKPFKLLCNSMLMCTIVIVKINDSVGQAFILTQHPCSVHNLFYRWEPPSKRGRGARR